MMASSHEQGNVLFLIMIVIALFAALTLVMTQGSRSGANGISKEKAAIAATDILNNAAAIKRTVQTLQINGCSDTEISFETPRVAGYTNPNAPVDNSCHVYHPDGGGLNYVAPDEEWNDASKSANNHYGTWFTSGAGWITGLGTDGSSSNCLGGAADGSCRELLTGIPYIQQEICLAINKKLSWGFDENGTPYQDNGNSYAASTHTNFIGTYSDGSSMGQATPSAYSNIMTGCIEGDSNPAAGSYSFFQVLIAR